MKRYTVIDVMKETQDGTEIYYSRAELIAAGVLVPVPDGEKCRYSVWLEQQSSTAFLLDDEVNVHVTINRYQSAMGGPSAPIEGDTIVHPVRLVKLGDVG